MNIAFPVENKEILLTFVNLELIKSLTKQNALLTLVTTAQLTDQLKEMRRRGDFGYIQRKLEPGDLSEKHWVITNSDHIRKRCNKIYRLVTLYGRNDLSDIHLSYETNSKQGWLLDDVLDHSGLDEIDPEHSDEDSDQTLYPSSESPKLYLVGVGPGSPDLLTIRAQKVIQSSSIIISDRLISPQIFSELSPSTKIIFTQKQCGRANISQSKINSQIIQYLNMGKSVVRVKGGDPYVFGRGGEEYDLVKDKYQVIYVPGVSSCVSAPGFADIPLTYRGIANRFVVCTGMLKDGVNSTIPDFIPHQTVVLLMAVGVLGLLKDVLLEKGFPLHTRVGLIYRASYDDQKVIRGCIGDIGQKAADAGIKNHATIVIGAVVDCLLNSAG